MDQTRLQHALWREAVSIVENGIADAQTVDEAIKFFWQDPLQPVLLQVQIDPEGNVYPKIAFGHPLTEMEPQFKPLEMEGT